MTITSRIGLLLLLVIGATGCVTPRELLGPTSFTHEDRAYIYLVEQEQMRDSRVKKCDIAADNSVKCETHYDLE